MMNKIKHITDWPAAESSVDWKGKQNISGCTSCRSQVRSKQFPRIMQSGDIEISGDRIIQNWEIDNYAYVPYQLVLNNNNLEPSDLPDCETLWYINNASSNTFIAEGLRYVGGSVEYVPTGENGFTINSFFTGAPITYVVLFAHKGTRKIELGVDITCDDTSKNKSIEIEINLEEGIVTSTDYPPPPPPLPPCTFQINGSSEISCDAYESYGPLYPNMLSGEYYTYELYEEGGFWKMHAGKNSSSVLVKAPTYNELWNNPKIGIATLCITKHHPGICEPTTLCKKITIGDCPIPRVEFDRDILNVGGRISGNVGSIANSFTSVDWPAIYKENTWPIKSVAIDLKTE